MLLEPVGAVSEDATKMPLDSRVGRCPACESAVKGRQNACKNCGHNLKQERQDRDAALRERLRIVGAKRSDADLDKIFKQIKKLVYRLQGKGWHCALLGYRVAKNVTLRFDTFGDDVLNAAFTETSATGEARPNQHQEAVMKAFYQCAGLNCRATRALRGFDKPVCAKCNEVVRGNDGPWCKEDVEVKEERVDTTSGETGAPPVISISVLPGRPPASPITVLPSRSRASPSSKLLSRPSAHPTGTLRKRRRRASAVLSRSPSPVPAPSASPRVQTRSESILAVGRAAQDDHGPLDSAAAGQQPFVVYRKLCSGQYQEVKLVP